MTDLTRRLQPEDLREDVFTQGVGTKTGMRITHIPTGASVDGNGHGRSRLRQFLLGRLTEIVKQKTNTTASGRKRYEVDHA